MSATVKTNIVTAASKAFNVTSEQIMGRSRKEPIANARHLAMWLYRSLKGKTLQGIAARFNRSDHTTVSNALQNVNDWIYVGDRRGAMAQELRARLKS